MSTGVYYCHDCGDTGDDVTSCSCLPTLDEETMEEEILSLRADLDRHKRALEVAKDCLDKCVILNGSIIQTYEDGKPVGPKRFEGNDPTALTAWNGLKEIDRILEAK